MPVVPPGPRLPQLNALRAFEAAARLGGFAAAAEELRVTPGAVAAHVKALEDEFQTALFERHSRGVRLNALGTRVLPTLAAAFDGLGQAVSVLRREAAPREVHIAALPALAQLWLTPRLPDLRRALPEVDVSITALEAPPNLKRVPFDLCLFFVAEPPQGGLVLGTDSLVPVCTPQLASRLTVLEDLYHVSCLSDSAWADDWAVWARGVHLSGGAFRGPAFSLYALAVQEALNGAGVLMGHRVLVADHIRSGMLVAPFDIEVPLPNMLCLWSLPGAQARGAAADVARFLVEHRGPRQTLPPSVRGLP